MSPLFYAILLSLIEIYLSIVSGVSPIFNIFISDNTKLIGGLCEDISVLNPFQGCVYNITTNHSFEQFDFRHFRLCFKSLEDINSRQRKLSEGKASSVLVRKRLFGGTLVGISSSAKDDSSSRFSTV